MLGIFDSGVGGLTIWEEIKKRDPTQGVLYFSDRANMPYGDKSPEEIVALTRYGIQTLLDHGATAIILACHTAVTHLPENFLHEFPCSFYNIATAALALSSGYSNIAVMGTTATIASHYYQTHLGNRLISAFACPKLAPMIEKGDIHLSVIEESLLPLPKQATTLLYACTHFPFIDSYIHSLTQIQSRLNPASHLVKTLPSIGKGCEDQFFTSGDREAFHSIASSLCHAKLSFPFSIKSLYC